MLINVLPKSISGKKNAIALSGFELGSMYPIFTTITDSPGIYTCVCLWEHGRAKNVHTLKKQKLN